ncbi:GNAT family N-acetyltransferase [Fibrella arboris]|uniref:GNAT family N-acetyltransferase n=1 Tax=Fibrella arboris TaxID=3242486 RepID=UPI003520E15F
MLRFLTRRQIDDDAWNRCVSEAHNALLYGHSWYLDAVTNLPDWAWEGLVQEDVPGAYNVVVPIPLRRRWGRWVVYQPLFCQFLALFSRQPVDPTPFLQAVFDRYRYASSWQLLLDAPLFDLPLQVRCQVMHTHVLPLRTGTASYTADRRMNLRRAARQLGNVPDWQITESVDVDPLLRLFRENHAAEIGVGEWAYTLFRGVFAVVQQRELGTLQYVWAAGEIVAGALFVEQHGRLIYLFNAANAEGRRLNARTVLIDRLIQEKQKKAPMPTSSVWPVLDFESPDKPGVVSFYESFGAVPQPYVVLSWSRLSWLERSGQRLLKQVKALISGRPMAVSNPQKI